MPKPRKQILNAVTYTAENWAKFLVIREQLLKQGAKRIIKVEVVS